MPELKPAPKVQKNKKKNSSEFNSAIMTYLQELDIHGEKTRYDRMQEWFVSFRHHEASMDAIKYWSIGDVQKFFMNLFMFVMDKLPGKPFASLMNQWQEKEEKWILYQLADIFYFNDDLSASAINASLKQLISSVFSTSPIRSLLSNIPQKIQDPEISPIIISPVMPAEVCKLPLPQAQASSQKTEITTSYERMAELRKSMQVTQALIEEKQRKTDEKLVELSRSIETVKTLMDALEARQPRLEEVDQNDDDHLDPWVAEAYRRSGLLGTSRPRPTLVILDLEEEQEQEEPHHFSRKTL